MYPSHHALLYIGQDSFDLDKFSKEKKSTHDVVVQRYAEFRINDARSLVVLATHTPINHSQRCFVIIADSIAIEAQNALLKLLEEPPAVSSFVFVLPRNTLLPTLKSRFMIMEGNVPKATLSPLFLEFIGETVPGRFSLIASAIDKKAVLDLATLRESLLHYLSYKRQVLRPEQVERIHWLATQMPLRGASVKMLWEDVAFILPVEVLATT